MIEKLSKHCPKGRQVAITGSIRTGSYENNAGDKIYTTDVVLDGFEFIGNSGNTTLRENQNSEFDGMEPVDDGDSPF